VARCIVGLTYAVVEIGCLIVQRGAVVVGGCGAAKGLPQPLARRVVILLIDHMVRIPSGAPDRSYALKLPSLVDKGGDVFRNVRVPPLNRDGS
jgi:hypothetical protein